MSKEVTFRPKEFSDRVDVLVDGQWCGQYWPYPPTDPKATWSCKVFSKVEEHIEYMPTEAEAQKYMRVAVLDPDVEPRGR